VHRRKRDFTHAVGVHYRRHIAKSECAGTGGYLSRSASHYAALGRRPGVRNSRNGASLVSAGWILLAVGIAAVVVMLVRSWARRDRQRDLGTVSHHWIAEQRFGSGQDSQR